MSNVAKEFEARIMLTDDEYLSIVSFYMKLFPNKHFVQNTNIYYDSEDLFLRRQGITFRHRIINDVSSELTIKIKGKDGDTEINDKLNLAQYNMLINNKIFPDGEVKKYLSSLPYPINEYKVITTLYNRRLEIENEDHLLVIDKNTYGDIVDYNLEIEAKDNIDTANKRLKEYIEKFHLSLINQKYQGKATRAIMAAKENR